MPSTTFIQYPEGISSLRSRHFPSYGSRRIHAQLLRDGHSIGKKFVKKAMKYMGIEALYPKPKTTTANKEHYKWSGNLNLYYSSYLK